MACCWFKKSVALCIALHVFDCTIVMDGLCFGLLYVDWMFYLWFKGPRATALEHLLTLLDVMSVFWSISERRTSSSTPEVSFCWLSRNGEERLLLSVFWGRNLRQLTTLTNTGTHLHTGVIQVWQVWLTFEEKYANALARGRLIG